MLLAEKRQIVATLLGDIDEAQNNALLDVYLADAENAILNRMHPFARMETDTIPPMYEMLQCKLATRYILRRGGEGEISHNENGINRTYGSVNDEDLLSEVMQVIR